MISELKKNKKRLLLAQLVAIFIWFIITVIQWANNPKNSPGLVIPVIVRITEAFSIFFVSGVFILIMEKFWSQFKRYHVWLILLVIIYTGAILCNILSIQLRSIIGYAPPHIDNYFFIQSLHFYIPLVLVMVFYGVVKTQMTIQQEREEKLLAESQAQQAKWIMLRYQVNPHFLFNALNSVRALIGQNDEKARKVITEMSEYFRYSLSMEKKPMVTVKEEMQAVENYLEIQKIRFQNKLYIETNITSHSELCHIPIFTIQTLVENAVKYGLKTSEDKLEIIIETSFIKNKLHILVKNTGKLVSPEKSVRTEEGSQTGIRNLKNRLRYLDEDYKLKLYESQDLVIAEVNLKIQDKS